MRDRVKKKRPFRWNIFVDPSVVRLESCMIVLSAPEGRSMVAGEFMPRLKRTFHHVAQRRDDHFPAPQPEDESPGYHHPVPPGRLILPAKT